ncbi:MAG: trypsin-like serine peptidase [Beijerinckiaceae bacterium]
MKLAAVILALFSLATAAAGQTRTEELMSSRGGSAAGIDASTVGYLEVDTGNRQNYGSASLIDPCHIKTAAHMFRTRPVGAVNAASRGKVSFGYERNGDEFNFASAHRIVSVAINPRFDPAQTQQPAHDVAVARIEPCVAGASIATDREVGLGDIGQLRRRFAVIGFVPDKDLRPRLFALRSCLWTGDGDALGILLNCPGRSGMSGGSVFMADGANLVDVGVFTSSVNVRGKTYGAFSPLSANRSILP